MNKVPVGGKVIIWTNEGFVGFTRLKFKEEY